MDVKMVKKQTYRCDPDPAREQQTRVLEPAREGEGLEGEVGVYYVDGEESNNGGLRGIIDEPNIRGISGFLSQSAKQFPSLQHTIETLSNQ